MLAQQHADSLRAKAEVAVLNLELCRARGCDFSSVSQEAQRLVEAALVESGRDNITAVVVEML